MKTSELTGAQLDYWVAKAEGYEAEILKDEKGEFVVRTKKFDNGGHSRGPFFPSTNWLDGGPLIEREFISLTGADQGWTAEHWMFDDPDCTGRHIGHGPTLLIAAMRAYVASRFGDEVPDEDV